LKGFGGALFILEGKTAIKECQFSFLEAQRGGAIHYECSSDNCSLEIF